MALTDTAVRNVKPSERTTKHFDGGGLFLEVTPQGSKRWRLKYRYLGKEKLLSLGLYPEIKLKDARDRRDELRKQLANGIDPSLHRKITKQSRLEKAGNTFEVVAREFHNQHSARWTESHSRRILKRLEQDLFPWIGSRPVAELTTVEILSCLRRIEKRGAHETAHRALQKCGQILRYAVVTGRAARDITVDLRGALAPVQEKHLPAITDPKKVGELLNAIDSFEGTFVVQSALKLAPLVFVRPGELRTAKWKDIDLEAKEWRYHVSKTKSEHIVPLSSQAIAILKELHPLTGAGEFVFPSARG